MKLNLRENYRYAIACPTSMGVRITPANRMAVHNSNQFMMQCTSAESNVLNVASSLGNECLVLTKFVKGSPIAEFIKSELRSRNIRFEGAEVEQGGPWGYRHQFNIADSGFGMRAPRVWNDRAGVPVPAFASALSYFDGYTTATLPANLLQAQRDYFGTHTYERIDTPRGQFFHTNWTGRGGNTSAGQYDA